MRPEESNDVLESWKQISTYLGVTVRTAQNWERNRGLPVHRDGSGPRARVLAYRRELDVWKSQRTVRQSTAPPKAPTFRRTTIMILVFLSLLTLVFYFAGTTDQGPAPGMPAASRLVDNTLEVRDAHGDLLWLKQFHDSVPRGSDTIVRDIDRDGRVEVLLALGDKPVGLPGGLVCFNEDGSRRWMKRFQETLRQGGRSFSEFSVKWFTVMTEDGRDYVLVSFANMYYPSATLLLDPVSGSEIGRYLHPGHFDLEIGVDLDEDGQDELLLGGVNNPNKGFGFPALAVLKVPFPSPDPSVPDFFGLPGGQEEAYFLFPRCDGDAAQLGLQAVRSLFLSGSDRINIGFYPNASFYVALNFALDVVDVRPKNELTSLHSRLFRTGVLDHPLSDREIEAYRRAIHRFPTAPDGNSAEVRSLMKVDWESGH